MAILINGMEMPKCCFDCELIDIVTSCPHYDLPSEAYCQIDYIRKRRDKDCPLVAVPDHHDLIDKNDLKLALMDIKFEDNASKDLAAVFREINLAKTIIPAEEGE